MKFQQLADKEWLLDKYCEQKMSLGQIAAEIGASSHVVVLKALKRHGIERRSKGEGQRLRYGQEDYFRLNRSVIEGCLLGDGGMKAENCLSNDSAPVFHKGNINYDHVLYVASLLFEEQPESRISECPPAQSVFGHSSPMFRLSTLTHPEMMELYREWYPPSNDYKKKIPDSIQVDGTVLLHWFLDDGYSYWVRHKNGKRPYLRIQFATQSFGKDELEMLSAKINASTGLLIRPRLHQRNGEVRGSGYHMELSQAQNEQFFETIGPPPVQSLAYKWKLL